MEPCKYLRDYDYFEVSIHPPHIKFNFSVFWCFIIFSFLQGSELAYIYACVFLFLLPLLCAGAGYCVVRLQDERKRKFRRKQEELKSGTKVSGAVDKMSVREWLHANHKRFVKVRFGPDSILYTVNRKGEKVRSVNFTNYETITVEESQVSSRKFGNRFESVTPKQRMTKIHFYSNNFLCS